MQEIEIDPAHTARNLLEQVVSERLVSIHRRVLSDPEDVANAFEWLIGLDLEFSNKTLYIDVDPDDDTLSISATPRELGPDELAIDGSNHPLWRPLIGEVILFAWTAINSRGYFDSVQLAFDTYQPSVSLVVAGSQLHEFYHREADRRVQRPVGDYTSTSKRVMPYRVMFPSRFDETWKEYASRGRMSDVLVEFENGDVHSLTFVSKRRVLDALGEGRAQHHAEPGLVIIEEITREGVLESVREMAKNGFFDASRPCVTIDQTAFKIREITHEFVDDLIEIVERGAVVELRSAARQVVAGKTSINPRPRRSTGPKKRDPID